MGRLTATLAVLLLCGCSGMTVEKECCGSDSSNREPLKVCLVSGSFEYDSHMSL
jgi:hypothetical protein